MSQTGRDCPLLYGKTFVNYVTTDYYSDYLQKCEVAWIDTIVTLLEFRSSTADHSPVPFYRKLDCE